MGSASSRKYVLSHVLSRNGPEAQGWKDRCQKLEILELVQRHYFKSCLVLCFLLYNVYLCLAIAHSWQDPDKCEGVWILVIISLTVYVYVFYRTVGRDYIIRPLAKRFYRLWAGCRKQCLIRRAIWTLITLALGIFLVLDTSGDIIRLQSCGGLLALLAFGYTFSVDRTKITWRPVLWGIAIQYVIAIVFLRWAGGATVANNFEWFLTSFCDNAKFGTKLVYGFLIGKEYIEGGILPGVIAYEVLPVMIFLGLWCSVLYYLGAMQKFLYGLGWLLECTMGTTACESMAAAANVGLNMPEVCLAIEPYLNVMTMSEHHAVMTSGFATIAIGFFVAYVKLGVHASSLMMASVMSAPASLAFSKLFYPETEKSRNLYWMVTQHKSKCRSLLESAVQGASSGMELMLRVICNAVAFISFITFCNELPSFLGSLVGFPDLSLKWLFGRLLLPVAFLIGVELQDCFNVAWLIGVNVTFANLAGYKIMVDMKRANMLKQRSEALATYAICGFSNLSYVGVIFSSLSSLAPDRKNDFAAIILRSFVSGTCSSLMTACIAGTVLSEYPDVEDLPDPS